MILSVEEGNAIRLQRGHRVTQLQSFPTVTANLLLHVFASLLALANRLCLHGDFLIEL